MLGSVIFSVVFETGRWNLERDGVTLAGFDSADWAERQGRWLAARAAVQGLESRLDLHDRFGQWLGSWRNEGFEPARSAHGSLAA